MYVRVLTITFWNEMLSYYLPYYRCVNLYVTIVNMCVFSLLHDENTTVRTKKTVKTVFTKKSMLLLLLF